MSKYLVFAAVSLVLLLSSISGTSVSIAFPDIISAFNTSLVLAGWVLSVNQLATTVVMPLAGKASDVFGRKRLFLVSTSLFGIGSLLCALAPNIELLIFFRIIQSVGGGCFLPLAAGAVTDEFPQARQQAIGLFTSIFPIGQIIGPNLGGWLVHAFGWRSVFWLNVPLSIIALVALALLLRSEKTKKSQVDVIGAGLFAASLSALMIGLSEIGNHGSQVALVLAGLLIAASIILLVVFIRYESRTIEPIIDLRVLRQKQFAAANIYNFAFGACVMGIIAFIPFYASSVFGMPTLIIGFILTPRSLGMMLASTVVSFSLVRWGYRRPMLVGTIATILSLLLLGVGSLGISIPGIPPGGTVWLAALLALMGIGIGIAAPAANNACIELMPDRVVTIVGIRGMFRQSGGAISIAATSLLLQTVGDAALGFFIVFIAMALALLIAIPVIFAMPSCPPAETIAQKTK